MYTYQEESRPIQEVYSEIGVLFGNAPDLIKDFKEFLPATAALAKAQAATSAQATADGLEAVMGEITAESPTVEGHILASWSPSPRCGRFWDFPVPDDTEALPKK